MCEVNVHPIAVNFSVWLARGSWSILCSNIDWLDIDSNILRLQLCSAWMWDRGDRYRCFGRTWYLQLQDTRWRQCFFLTCWYPLTTPYVSHLRRPLSLILSPWEIGSWFYSVPKRKFQVSNSIRSQPVSPHSSPIIRPVRIVAKGAYWRHSVPPSLRLCAWARLHWTDFLEIWYWWLLWKICREKANLCKIGGGGIWATFAL